MAREGAATGVLRNLVKNSTVERCAEVIGRRGEGGTPRGVLARLNAARRAAWGAVFLRNLAKCLTVEHGDVDWGYFVKLGKTFNG